MDDEVDTTPYAETTGPETPIPTEEIQPPAAPEEKPAGRRGRKAKATSAAESSPGNGAKKRKAGGRRSAVKGSSFERSVGKSLSSWLTDGERNNLFNRNVMSGGQWTSAVSRGKTGNELNLPGDLAAAHPQAFEFLKWFCIEVKHNNLLVLGAYLLDDKHKSFIDQVITKVSEQATTAGLHWLFIGKQDRRPTFVLMDKEVGNKVVQTWRGTDYHWHWLFNNTILMIRFDDLLTKVDPNKLLESFVPTPITPVSRVPRRTLPVLVKPSLPRRPMTAR